MKLAAREGSRFLLLCLIDINMKYSGVVLIRLGFPARGRGGALLLDQNIFSKNILLESSPPPPFPALASKARQCVLGCCTHTPQPPPLHGRLADWPARRTQPGSCFFQQRHLAPWQPHKQLCWQRGWPGSVLFRLLPGSHPQTPCSLSTSGPFLPSPTKTSRGWRHLRASESSAPCLARGLDPRDPPEL